MLARRYDTRVELWDYNERTPDGYGGFESTETKIKTVWASKETSGAGTKFKSFGLNEFKEPLIFRIRQTELTDDTFIKYKGLKYIVKGVENVDLEEREINIFAERE